MRKGDRTISWGLFFAFFSLYLFTAGGWVVPYRDAGEMSAVLATLGVAHPPGYPLYSLLGRLFLEIPLGNLAYRANVFSAVCGAAALSLFFLLLRTWMPRIPSLVGVLLLGFSHPFWELSVVTEMYALGAVFLVLILLALLRWNNPPLLAFVSGLALGVRMDLLLLVPVFFFWAWRNDRTLSWLRLMVFFALGCSIFLYLPLRSLSDPVLDWANPETLSSLLSSVTRKSYGSTLDLVSLSYQKGANFGVNMAVYGRHLWNSFGVGILFSALGLGVALWRGWRPGALVAVLFAVTGPLFLFLANMPPNPHSVAIVEASYLPPDMAVAFFAAWGVSALWVLTGWRRAFTGFVCAAGLAVTATAGYERNGKRDVLGARDFVENAFRSLPARSVAVFHDDVQLFSLWHAQLIDRRRADLGLVSSGLSASPWYWDMMSRWNVQSAPAVEVKTVAGWRAMEQAASSRPFLAGYDSEVPAESGLSFIGSGAVVSLRDDAAARARLRHDPFTALLLFRDRRVYGRTPDFFSSDLIGDMALALNQFGTSRLLHNMGGSEPFLIRAAMKNPTFARPLAHLGYVYFMKNQFPEAESAYREAIQRGGLLLKDAQAYRALPEAAESIRKEMADALVSLGGTLERQGNRAGAEQAYVSSLSLTPNAQAHYNLSVLSWNQDWDKVEHHLQEALRLNPNMAEAKKYLLLVKSKRKPA